MGREVEGDYLMDANGTLDAVQKSVDNKIIDYSFDSDCLITNQIEQFLIFGDVCNIVHQKSVNPAAFFVI